MAVMMRCPRAGINGNVPAGASGFVSCACQGSGPLPPL